MEEDPEEYWVSSITVRREDAMRRLELAEFMPLERAANQSSLERSAPSAKVREAPHRSAKRPAPT
jgi:hypothetical protein